MDNRMGQTQQPLGVWLLAVLLSLGVWILSLHLDNFHPRLVLEEIGRVSRQAAHNSTAQDEIQLIKLPLLRVHTFRLVCQSVGRTLQPPGKAYFL